MKYSDVFLSLAVAVTLTGMVLAASPQRIHGHFMLDLSHDVTDDALFYPQIARNIACGAGSTLNGVMPTNGYQPLWAVVLVPLALVTRDGVTLLRAAVGLGGLLLLLSMVISSRAVRRAGSPHGWFAVLCLGAGVGALGTWLSEAHLSALLCTALIARTLRASEDDPPWASLVDGALCGLVVLARLDQILFALAGLVALGLTRDRTRSTVTLGAAFALVITPYLAWNHHRFGHVFPISSAIRVHHGIPRFSLARLGWLGALLALASCAVALVNLHRKPSLEQRRAALWFFLAVFSHGVVVAWFSSMARVPHWYWAQTLAFVAVFGPIALGAVGSSHNAHGLRALALALVAFAVPSGISLSRRLHPTPRSRLLLVDWAIENIAPHERVFVADSPGILAYWSGLRVIAADGLTGDFAFQDSLAARGVLPTLQALGVRRVLYVDNGIGAWFVRPVRAWPRPYDVARLVVASTVHSTTSELVLRESDELSRLELGVGEVDTAVLWSLPAQGMSIRGGSTLGTGVGLK